MGYALARDAWGKAYAHEALRGLLEGTASIGLQELYALCHCQHLISARVLEKCGFKLDGRLTCYTDFPNLGLEERSDVFRYMYTSRYLAVLPCFATRLKLSINRFPS